MGLKGRGEVLCWRRTVNLREELVPVVLAGNLDELARKLHDGVLFEVLVLVVLRRGGCALVQGALWAVSTLSQVACMGPKASWRRASSSPKRTL